ncbi:hypothetical protein BGX26_012531 [Mortierella sp. AD094]|nr:hypothetical protein BGX26_012531 [Mortierella sp. AD094]
MERIGGGILSRLKYIFMVRFTTNKHHFGRAMVLVAFIISMALTALPTVLNSIYPVKDIYVDFNNENVFYDYKDLRLVDVEPDGTDIVKLMDALGMDTIEIRFLDYNRAPVPVSQCTLSLVEDSGGNDMYCFGNSSTTVNFGTIANPSTVFLYNTNIPGLMPNMSISPNNSNYKYFQMSDIDNLVPAYTNIGPVSAYSSKGYISDDFENGVRSLESCLAMTTSTRQCVRNTLSYLVIDGEGVLIVMKKLIYEGVSVTKAPGQDSGFCDRLANQNLRDMCALASWKWGTAGGLIGYQSTTNTTQGIRFDTLWLGNQQSGQFGAISLDISVVGYSGTPNTIKLPNISSNSTNDTAMSLWGQELFEATKIHVSNDYQNNSDWFNWGFSQDDINNMTNFLIQGGPMFNGGLVLAQGQLLAKIPASFLGATVGLIVLLFFIGYMVGRGVDPAMNRPISETLAALVKTTSDSKPSHFWSKKEVANLTLTRPTPSSGSSEKTMSLPTINIDGFNVFVERE